MIYSTILLFRRAPVSDFYLVGYTDYILVRYTKNNFVMYQAVKEYSWGIIV